MSAPIDKKLYDSVKHEAKRRFKVWPSAYASGWLVKEYKRRGGRYRTPKKSPRRSPKKSPRRSPKKSPRRSPKKSPRRSPKKSPRRSPKKSPRSHSSGLNRWFREKWVNACSPTKRPCGRSRSQRKGYPYCRPTVRVSSTTPRTLQTFSKEELKRRCKSKRRDPRKKIR
jgi:hypothetical protein